MSQLSCFYGRLSSQSHEVILAIGTHEHDKRVIKVAGFAQVADVVIAFVQILGPQSPSSLHAVAGIALHERRLEVCL